MGGWMTWTDKQPFHECVVLRNMLDSYGELGPVWY